jgi:cyanate permease
VTRVGKVLSLGIGLTAFAILATLGFAIWVFIPLLPAGLVFVIAVLSIRRRATKPERSAEVEADSQKAA